LEVTDYRPFPIEGLTRISDALEKEATEVEKSAVPGTLLKMKAQQTELAAKKLLYTRRDSIKTYVGQLRTAKKYDQCIAETDFRSITDKGKDILTKTLTPQLQEALLEELGALNARHIPLRLKATGREGETLHKLELMGCPSSVKANLTEILSEGEQHVVAVAGFLAELRVSNPLCPIVFDDPVCSLDHLYRGKIAKRLAREATSRQVIIFTHDIAFLLELEATTAELGGYFFYQMVLREGGTPGYCTEKKPWHTMSVKERITYLDSKLKELSNIHKTDKKQYNEQAARLYGLLRESWEATVEEVLLKGVIIRHGSEVKTLLLRYVTVTDEDYRTIFFGMGKCSEWMTGHDKARSLDENRPAPVEVSLDIQSLRNFVTSVNKRNEDIEKQRKESVKAQVATAG
jgi:ABC-type lipoprotein export system ATPase subunit